MEDHLDNRNNVQLTVPTLCAPVMVFASRDRAFAPRVGWGRTAERCLMFIMITLIKMVNGHNDHDDDYLKIILMIADGPT